LPQPCGRRAAGGRRRRPLLLLLLLVVFGLSDRSSGVSLLSIALLAPAVLVLLLAFPLRQGSLAWFGAVESGFISLIGLLWAYGLFIAPSLAANVRTDSPSLYDLAGAAYIYAGLPLLGILLIALALRYRHDPASGRESGCDAQDGERSPATRSERTGGTE